MKVALTHVTVWPEVRRGAERFINELGRYLGSRGHEVTAISTRSGPTQVTQADGVTTIKHRRMWHPAMAKLGIRDTHPFFLTTLTSLLSGDFDVVHCCGHTDAVAACLARKVTGVPVLFWINGIPLPNSGARRLAIAGSLFQRALSGADEAVALSQYMNRHLQERFGRKALTIPVPVDLQRFPLVDTGGRRGNRIVCAAALDDPRKGGDTLMRAFNILKDYRPETRLQIAQSVAPTTKDRLLGVINQRWRQDVEFLGAGKPGDLPEILGRASISVLPSMWEGYGMLTMEALASGTAVVGTAHGAIPELITSRDIGRLFEPGEPDGQQPSNVRGLAIAMHEAMALSELPETPMRCRSHASQFAWPCLGPRFEQLYERMVAAARNGPRASSSLQP